MRIAVGSDCHGGKMRAKLVALLGQLGQRVVDAGSYVRDDEDYPEIAALVQACPQAQFILVNGIGFAHSQLGRSDNGLPANYYLEISRLSAVLANEIGQLITNLGAERVVFGTGMPFQYPDPSLVKMEVLEASEEDKEKIRWRNAARLLPGEEPSGGTEGTHP